MLRCLSVLNVRFKTDEAIWRHPIKSARLQAWIRCKIREAERFTAFFRLIGDSAVAPLVLLVTPPSDGLAQSILLFSD
jgi:hypothetical protein